MNDLRHRLIVEVLLRRHPYGLTAEELAAEVRTVWNLAPVAGRGDHWRTLPYQAISGAVRALIGRGVVDRFTTYRTGSPRQELFLTYPAAYALQAVRHRP